MAFKAKVDTDPSKLLDRLVLDSNEENEICLPNFY